jgi:hypothetical protein
MRLTPRWIRTTDIDLNMGMDTALKIGINLDVKKNPDIEHGHGHLHFVCNAIVRSYLYISCKVAIVPNKRRRILEVVVVRRILAWVLGIWSGEGMRKG